MARDKNNNIESLKECKTDEDIDNFFSYININSFSLRCYILMRHMGVKDVTSADVEADDTLYRLTKQEFLSGNW